MKKILFILSYSIYLFLFFGLIFHTSAHPEFLGKYTYKYVAVLVSLILFFPFFLWLTYSVDKSTTIKIKKKRFTLRPIQKIVLLLVLISFLMMTIEIFLRTKYKDYESNTYTYTIENFDPFLQSKIAKHENLVVNNLGFRGEDIEIKKPQNTFRIFVLGGSTVLNREVTFEKNAVRLLEKKLRSNFPKKKIEAINAGKDYYTSEHSLIQYLFKISDLSPDLIIMWHGANDVGMSCTREGIISHGEYKSDYSHNFGAVSNIVFDYFRPRPLVRIELVTFDFLSKAFKDNLYSDFFKKIIDNNKKEKARKYQQNINTVTVRDFPSLPAYSRNLEYFVTLIKAKNTPLILGDQPTLIKKNNTLEEIRAIINPGLACSKGGKYYSLQSSKYANDLFNMEAKRIAENNSVIFVGLDKEIPKTLDYFTDGFHYTEAGNQKIADALYNVILSNNLIPE